MSVGIFFFSPSFFFFTMIACRGAGPAVSPRNVRKTTVMPGNREDRGRQQLDQVSPLDIDSFFPLVRTCVRASVWETRLSQRFQFFKHLSTKKRKKERSAPRGASRTGPRFGWRALRKKNAVAFKNGRDGKTKAKFLRKTTGRDAPTSWLDATEDVRRCIWGIQRRHLPVSRNSSRPRRAS